MSGGKLVNASQVAWSTPFETNIDRSNGFPDNIPNVQEAIEYARSNPAYSQFLTYQLIGQMNYDQYLYSMIHSGDFSRRSGNASNGYRYSNCAPLTSVVNGNVVSASASITGIAVSTGSYASSINLLFELWHIGYNSEGVSIGNIEFDIDTAGLTIGTYWDSSILTAYEGEQAQTGLTISAGNLLGLKFIRQTGTNAVVAVQNATIVLALERSS